MIYVALKLRRLISFFKLPWFSSSRFSSFPALVACKRLLEQSATSSTAVTLAEGHKIKAAFLLQVRRVISNELAKFVKSAQMRLCADRDYCMTLTLDNAEDVRLGSPEQARSNYTCSTCFNVAQTQ